MATLNLTSTIAASGLTTDELSSTVLLTNASITTGGIQRVSTTAVKASKAVLLDASTFPNPTNTTSVYLYVKNVGPKTIRLSVLNETGNNEESEISLTAGTWMMFPWAAATDVTMYQTAAGTSVVEYGVFG
tara:strand:- start:485 stop:877 length:393 start_codon:yes stop_codon:yes gene_type:complete